MTFTEDIKRILAGYRPKSDSFLIFLTYTINGVLSTISLRIRLLME